MLILNCLLTVISRSEPQLTHFISALNAHVLRAKDLIAGLQRKLKSPYVWCFINILTPALYNLVTLGVTLRNKKSLVL